MNVANVRDEDESLAVIDAERGARAGGFRAPSLLQHHTAIVLAFGRLDVVGRGARQPGEALEQLLHLFRCEQVVRFATTGGHELENAPERRPNLVEQADERIELAQILASESGVDLDWNAYDAVYADCVDKLKECFSYFDAAAEVSSDFRLD